ncbi:DNA kinase/phosphatase Pnk1 [Boothiomyces sp. JEL0838]|nr:DNA kinase/phosphatase Pnk1 [Boothiomyces sp. JEL0838]
MKRKTEDASSNTKKQSNLNAFLNIKPIVDWSVRGSVIFGKYGDYQPSEKVAAFDFDGTIANTKSGNVMPKDGNDWEWFCSSVPHVLQKLSKAGYSIVIFSNQKNALKDHKVKNRAAFQGRIEKTIKELQAMEKGNGEKVPPMLIYAAAEDDLYRKPRTKMWDLYISMYPEPMADTSKSFYCGDAAGRSHRNADHADTDYKWALNLNMQFIVPQQLFSKDAFKMELDYKTLQLFDHPPLPEISFQPSKFETAIKLPDLDQYDILVCVGSPASGKSTFCSKKIPQFNVINQDTLRSLPNCIKLYKQYLSEGKKIVIDNTNPQEATRKKYLELKNGKKAACLYFTASLEICIHNNFYREFLPLVKGGTEKGKNVPKIALHTYWSKFEKPNLKEGFDAIYEIPFSLEFQDDTERNFWKQYLI